MLEDRSYMRKEPVGSRVSVCIILIAVTLLPLAAAGLWLKFGAARP